MKTRLRRSIVAPLDPLEAALCDDDGDDPLNPGHPLKERWAREAALPRLSPAEVSEMLARPMANWSHDRKMQLRNTLEAAGRLEEYSRFIAARMRAKGENEN